MRETRKILVVEDEPDLRDILLALLNEDYDNVDQAENGQIGLEVLQKQEYSVVLSDIKMPHVDGLTFFSRAKAQGLTMPFVFLTAFGDQKNILMALRLGAFDFIKKPFNEAEVQDVVKRGLEVGFRRSRIQEQLQKIPSEISKNVNQDEKFIRLLELNNYKKRA